MMMKDRWLEIIGGNDHDRVNDITCRMMSGRMNSTILVVHA